jgi:hypothetical protein
MMSNRRVGAVTILVFGLMTVPQAWGSIPVRLQAAAAARNAVTTGRGQPAETKLVLRAPAATPSEGPATLEAPETGTPTLDMPALETPELDAPELDAAVLASPVLISPGMEDNDDASVLEPAAEDATPALEPVPLESPLEEAATPPTTGVKRPSRAHQNDADDATAEAGATPEKVLGPSKTPAPTDATQTPDRVSAPRGPSKSSVAPSKPGSAVAPNSKITTAPPAAAAQPAKTLSPEMTRLRNRIRTCLSYYYQRPTSVDERSPWGVMHSLIAFGVDTELVANNKRVNAIGWLCYNRPCKGMTLMTVKDGQLAMRQNGPGYQGHDGQLLSMLALSGVKSNYPIRAEGHEFTVADLVTFEQLHCKPKSELTFQLIGLAHYLPSDATWQDKTGGEWSIPRLIREEIAQPVNGAACGGTHRLIALSMAAKTRQKRSEPLDGEWLRAQKLVVSYQQLAFKLQNRDGSFSTSWLVKRDDTGDIDRRIQTSGHILEWLIFSLPEKNLSDQRLVKGISYLTNTLMNNDKDWEIGPRGHALRALALYNERVFGDKPGERRELLARRPGK